jgi:hypothetical protein
MRAKHNIERMQCPQQKTVSSGLIIPIKTECKQSNKNQNNKKRPLLRPLKANGSIPDNRKEENHYNRITDLSNGSGAKIDDLESTVNSQPCIEMIKPKHPSRKQSGDKGSMGVNLLYHWYFVFGNGHKQLSPIL